MRARLVVVLAVFAVACGGSQKVSRDKEPLADRDPYALHRAIGETLLRTEQPRRALPHLRRLVRLRPKTSEPYYLLGRAFMEMRLWKAASGMFERALAIKKDFAAAYSMLGVVYDSSGDHDRADAAYRQAIELDPQRASFYNNLGFSLYLRGEYQGALEAYEQALSLNAAERRTHNNIGFAYGKLGEVDDAWAHFRLGGSKAQAINNLGLVYEGRGDLDRAVELFVQALAENAELTAARGNLERVCKRLGRPVPEIPVKGGNP
jgi:Flp pilus assembly protein TadD